jgi:hypothetical protein
MITFFHKSTDPTAWGKYSDRFTIAYETTTITLEQMLCHLRYGTKLALNIGKAVCHHKDQYNKKVGRELATSRMELQLFDLQSLQSHEDSVMATYRLSRKLTEEGHLIHKGKSVVYGFHVIYYRDSGKSRIRFYSDAY